MASLKFMEKENLKIKKEITSTEEENLFMDEVLKKYGLIKIQEEEFKKIIEPSKNYILSSEKRIEIFNNLPKVKINKLINELVSEKITFSDFISILQNQFNFSETKAKNIAVDLKEIISYAEKTGPIIPLAKQPKLESDTVKNPETETPLKTKRISTSQNQDTYREPVE